MSININAIETAGTGLMKSLKTNLGSKLVGTAGGAIAATSMLGSYDVYKDVWRNEAAQAQREALLNANVYQRTVGFTGNDFLDPIFSTIADPNFMHADLIRKVYYTTTGFAHDVLLRNTIPIILGGTAMVWGFNQSLGNTIGKASYSLATTGKLGYTGTTAILNASKAIMPNVDIKPALRYLTPKTPRAVLSMALLVLLGGVYLPIRVLDIARGRFSERVGEDMNAAYRRML